MTVSRRESAQGRYPPRARKTSQTHPRRPPPLPEWLTLRELLKGSSTTTMEIVLALHDPNPIRYGSPEAHQGCTVLARYRTDGKRKSFSDKGHDGKTHPCDYLLDDSQPAQPATGDGHGGNLPFPLTSPFPATVFWFVLRNGMRMENPVGEPVPLSGAAATGRNFYRETLSPVAIQEVRL